MYMGILKVFDHEYKELKRFEKIVEEIDALEEEYKKLSDEELKHKTVEFKERLKNTKQTDSIKSNFRCNK